MKKKAKVLKPRSFLGEQCCPKKLKHFYTFVTENSCVPESFAPRPRVLTFTILLILVV